MWSIFPCAFLTLHFVITIYLLKVGPVWNSFPVIPGHFLRAGVIYSLVGLVTVKSPSAPVSKCIY